MNPRLSSTAAVLAASLGTVALATFSATVAAAQITVLSAGAIEPGLKAAATAYESQSGHKVAITFNTAPALKARMDGNPAFDVVIAPPTVLAEFAAAGKLGAARANVGRVGMGVAVREGDPSPDIEDAAAFRKSVLAAGSLVFNRASTGLYLEGLLKKMELYAQVEPKVTRYPDGAAVMEHVIKGDSAARATAKGGEIGFGAITEIMLYSGKGLKFVGPLPAELQNYTAYSAAPLASGGQAELAAQFVGFLGGPIAKPLFIKAGVTD